MSLPQKRRWEGIWHCLFGQLFQTTWAPFPACVTLSCLYSALLSHGEPGSSPEVSGAYLHFLPVLQVLSKLLLHKITCAICYI